MTLMQETDLCLHFYTSPNQYLGHTRVDQTAGLDWFWSQVLKMPWIGFKGQSSGLVLQCCVPQTCTTPGSCGTTWIYRGLRDPVRGDRGSAQTSGPVHGAHSSFLSFVCLSSLISVRSAMRTFVLGQCESHDCGGGPGPLSNREHLQASAQLTWWSWFGRRRGSVSRVSHSKKRKMLFLEKGKWGFGVERVKEGKGALIIFTTRSHFGSNGSTEVPFSPVGLRVRRRRLKTERRVMEAPVVTHKPQGCPVTAGSAVSGSAFGGLSGSSSVCREVMFVLDAELNQHYHPMKRSKDPHRRWVVSSSPPRPEEAPPR